MGPLFSAPLHARGWSPRGIFGHRPCFIVGAAAGAVLDALAAVPIVGIGTLLKALPAGGGLLGMARDRDLWD